MKSIFNILLLVIFCLWLLPLGQFIQDRQSELCGGQRAFCMCLVPAAKKTVNSISLTTNTSNSSQKEAPGGGAGHDFESVLFAHPILNNLVPNFPPMIDLPSSIIIRNIEHIPKF